MGRFFESLGKMFRRWWRSIVGLFKRKQKPKLWIDEDEIATRRVIEAATEHEEEAHAEREMGEERIQYRTRPESDRVVHHWTEDGFNLWWENADEDNRRSLHLTAFSPPEGLKLQGDDYAYWDARARLRSLHYDFTMSRRSAETPQ